MNEPRAYMPAPVRHDWQTPECVLERVRKVGPIRLDPCTSAENPTGARTFFTEVSPFMADKRWANTINDRTGVVFVNPPYGRALPLWARRIATNGEDLMSQPMELNEHQHLIALTPARTDTKWFRLMLNAQRIAFWHGRLKFKGAEHAAPFPSALFYYGHKPELFEEAFNDVCWVTIGPITRRRCRPFCAASYAAEVAGSRKA